MRRLLTISILILIILSGFSYGDIKFEGDNYSLESRTELKKEQFSSKLPNDGGYIHYDMYTSEKDNVTISFYTKEGYDIDIYKAMLAGEDFLNVIEMDYAYFVNQGYYQCTFNKYGTYMIEIRDENKKLLQKFPIFIGGMQRALEEDKNYDESIKISDEVVRIDNLTLSYNDSHNVSIYSDGKYIVMEGAYDLNNVKYILYNIRKENSKNDIKKDTKKLDREGNFKVKIRNNLSDGEYTFGIYTSSKSSGSFDSFIYDIPFKVEDGELFFERSYVYENNRRLFEEIASKKDLDQYLEDGPQYDIKNEELIRISNTITKGLDTDYEKTMAIHDWVADNIYYDYDSFYSGKYPSSLAIEVLNSKKSVCEGYSNLTVALTRIAGIPCRKVSGYALGVGTRGEWTTENIYNGSNHAWNESYVDGRWIIIDSTWSSKNKFQNGKFQKEKQNREYFDTTLEFFSLKHKIMGY